MAGGDKRGLKLSKSVSGDHLYELIRDFSRFSEVAVEDVLRFSNEWLGTDIGILSHIKSNQYTVENFYTALDLPLEIGSQFDLHTTYCDITFQLDRVLSIDDMGQSTYADHPCYKLFKLESYIGVPFWVNGRAYGTINFSSITARKIAFNSNDHTFILAVSQLVSRLLERKINDSILIKKDKAIVSLNQKLRSIEL